jgi:hypothetical protein
MNAGKPLQRLRASGQRAAAVLDSPKAERARQASVAVALLTGFCFFAVTVDRHYPIGDWLCWRYAQAWLLALVWFGGCMSAGWVALRWLTPRLPLGERLILSCSTGVYVSYLLMFLGGIAGLYRFGAFAVALPLAMLASGARPLVRTLVRAAHHLRGARRLLPPRPTLVGSAIAAFGTVYVALVYLSILDPDNASFDALYYHLGIAQQYKALGGITRNPEGWIVDGLPLLASVNYTWAFIFPTLDLFDSMALCAHMEFVIFLATLASVPVVVRYLVPRGGASGAWAAMFLFPAILVYDAGLHSGNDHIAAFFGPPIWLALRRCWPRLEPRYMALFAVTAAGALMTKYQAMALVIAPALALSARGVWLGHRKARAPWRAGLAVAFGVALLVTTPHWLRNWIWYGDPLFPALYRHLQLRPFHPHALEALDQTTQVLARPHGTFAEQLGQIWRGSWSFPFQTRERSDFHRDWPVFGPIFHLSILWLPFLRGTRRTWLLFGATFTGLFFWYSFNHHERYLQPLVPWMAAVAAAGLVLVWREGRLARAAAVLMVGLEVVWGADAYFFPHLMLQDSAIKASANLISSGFRDDFASRQQFLYPFKEIGETLPPGSVVLLHESCLRVGLNAPVVMDYPGFQTRISYRDLSSAREVYELYKALGITHIVYRDGHAALLDTLGNDLRFWDFASNWGKSEKHFGPLVLAELPEQPPDPTVNDRVAYLGCDTNHAPGLHDLAALGLWPSESRWVDALVPAPKSKPELEELVARAGFLVTGRTCKNLKLPASIYRDFTKVAVRGKEDLWVRSVPVRGDVPLGR